MDVGHKNFKLKVGAHKLAVKHVSSEKMEEVYRAYADDVDEDSECLGACCFRIDGHEILIDGSLSGSRYVATVWHEVVELVNNLYDLGLNHPQISTLGEVLTQVHGDNRRVISTLTDEI